MCHSDDGNQMVFTVRLQPDVVHQKHVFVIARLFKGGTQQGFGVFAAVKFFFR
jgi:hypothetical protein